jgi:glycosyltransferase involved in cell wall biosynthesis
MRRIAYLSPVNPASSGISDYSEELLPYLGAYAEVTLFVAEGLRPRNPLLARHLDVLPIRRLEGAQRRRPFDAILYHLGNSEVHAEIWRAAQRLPGVIVLHEWVLHHFRLWYAVNVERAPQRYREEMARRYGGEGAAAADRMLRGRLDAEAFRFPLVERAVEVAEGLIAHSEYVLGQARALRPELPMARVPMGVPLPPQVPREAARARLGLPSGALLLASFGHINPYKRLDSALRALRQLRAEGHDARYLLVGSVSPHVDLAGTLQRLGLADGEAVLSTGYVDRAAFHDYLAAADICLNLRHPTAGETSASLLRLLGAGRPTLVSATGSFAELPAHVVAKVDVGSREEAQILAYCRLLAGRPELAAALGGAARAFVAQEHSLERAAAAYMAFLATRYGWGEVRPMRAPLWELADDAPATQGTQARRAAAAPAASPLHADVGRALAELGVREEDEALLRSVAATLAELVPPSPP